MKKIRLNENDIENLVKKIISEDLPRRERDRHRTQFAKSKFDPYEREEQIMKAFGPYKDDVPANVISYLRKNPRTFLKRLTNHYGMDKMLDFIGYEVSTPPLGPVPEFDENDDEWPTTDEIRQDVGGYSEHMSDDMCEGCGSNHMGENKRRRKRS